MSWLKVHVDVDEAAVEPLETVLTAIGATAIELADAEDDAIFEPAPGTNPLWRRVRVTALFDPSVDDTTVRLAVASTIEPGSMPPIRFEVIEDEDWVARLREELKPLRFGDGLWVCPPGKSPDGSAHTVLTMEPGLAFGTGTHPTTSLCMDWLAANAPTGSDVLDYGCGSGILGIAALALGAASVAAVDIDPQALSATRRNADRNPGADRLITCLPTELDAGKTCDVLLANILSGTLIELAPLLRGRCRRGAVVALSGILSDQAEEVAAAFRDWLAIGPPIERGGWVLLTGTVE